MGEQLPNQASLVLADKQTEAKAEITFGGQEINWLHAVTDKPGAEFDVVIADRNDNEQYRTTMKGATNRYGQRISLPILDNYYIIKAMNVKGANKIDIFLD